ncbi:hypothetical protein C2857_006093 [Epichloe festucae Fl1]|uniref:AMP-activated protein kinase glycogen-binding domain-containing protein n=1 Tax=Epichloe festucae (strain Fl1) TaxID=877507 RepID=A0A7S9KT83_EPIFF|nr:hypothetical protein C2857_006093 [Epichloe festucae Fl1]
MSTGKTTVTVSYRRRGLAPPVFVAGSFADPQWELQEMHSVTDESGEHHFAIQIPVEPGKEYLYKFRAGSGHDWFLDEHATISHDHLGQRCNLLRVPVNSNTGDRIPTPVVEATEQCSSRAAAGGNPAIAASGPKSLPPNVFRDKTIDAEQRSGTPVKQVAAVAAEVADTAAKLDSHILKPSPLVLPRDDASTDETTEQQIDTPLFAHESFGAYEFVGAGFDHNNVVKTSGSPTSLPSDSGGSVVCDDVDIADPTVEKFPSDRESVLDTLRKIQSSAEEGRASLDDGQHSAVTTSGGASVDSSEENDFSLGPSPSRRRDTRTSRGSFGRPISAVSLSCIAEEPKAPEDANALLKHGESKKSQAVSTM